MKKKVEFLINKKKIGINYPTYFIADIAANHDGNFQKAIDLVNKAKECGADAAKFQHFSADTIVSKKTFDEMRTKLSHQKQWKKSVHQVYDEASLKLEWTAKLKKECDKIQIDFFTAPYSIDLINYVNKYVCAYKVGSGDITWIDSIVAMAKKKKPIIFATGAASLKDVKRAINNIKKYNNKICIMQCNTNYTADIENLKYINLNVLKNYKKNFPYAVLGLSDHTHGHSTVLGAISYGARIIEKHFTLSNKLDGPDHKFSMNPKTWLEMINRSRELENALGSTIKKIEDNEKESYMVQRRSIHFKKKMKKNEKILEKDLIYLRPYLKNSFHPFEKSKIIGKKVNKNFDKGEIIFWKDLK